MFENICLDYRTLSYRNGVRPIFGTHNTTTFPDKFVDREIRDLTVTFENKENGCKWNDRLRIYEVRNVLLLFFLFYFRCSFSNFTLKHKLRKITFNSTCYNTDIFPICYWLNYPTSRL